MSLELGETPISTQLEEERSFEALLIDLSSDFVNLPSSEVDKHIESALKRVAGFLSVDRISFGELSQDGHVVTLTHTYTTPGITAYAGGHANPLLPWWVEEVRRGHVLRLENVFEDLPPEAVKEREFCLQNGIKSHLTIPLKVGGKVACVINLVAIREGRDWPDVLIHRLRTLGEIFVNALVRQRSDEILRVKEHYLRESRERLRRLTAKLIHVQEEERRRIAREMHDDWTQRLALLGVNIAQIKSKIQTDENTFSAIHKVQEQLVSLSEDMHNLSRQLHPSILDDLGIVEALRSECAVFARREGIIIKYCPEPISYRVEKNVALCLYRVAQEALRNLVKHAAVDEARVSIRSANSEIVLLIEDKGIGFDLDHVRTGPGLGLTSMEERVGLIPDGKLNIRSSPGFGTTIEVRVALTPNEST